MARLRPARSARLDSTRLNRHPRPDVRYPNESHRDGSCVPLADRPMWSYPLLALRWPEPRWPPGVPAVPLLPRVALQVFVLVLAAQRAMQVYRAMMALILAVVTARRLDAQTARTNPSPLLGMLGDALVVQQVA